MIIENQAVEVEGVVVDVAHKIEILCPSCQKDVDTKELEAQVCYDCGASLADPQQNVELHATSIPLFAIVF